MTKRMTKHELVDQLINHSANYIATKAQIKSSEQTLAHSREEILKIMTKLKLTSWANLDFKILFAERSRTYFVGGRKKFAKVFGEKTAQVWFKTTAISYLEVKRNTVTKSRKKGTITQGEE